MASHVINNIADSYAHEHDAVKWKNEIKALWENMTISRLTPSNYYAEKKKLYDFKQTRQRKVYNRISKSKRIPFFRTSKKMLFFKSI